MRVQCLRLAIFLLCLNIYRYLDLLPWHGFPENVFAARHTFLLALDPIEP